MKTKTLVVLNIISFLGTMVLNYLSNAIPINGKNMAELSAQYPNEFVPAGYTFSIWLIIYLFLIGFCIYQAGGDTERTETTRKMGYLFILTNVFNVSWLLLWHYEMVLFSVFAMISLLITLIAIHQRFGIPDKRQKTSQKLWVQVPFSIYLGWIIIATVANITAWLVDLGWNGEPMTGAFWAIVMIAIATLLNMVILASRKNYVIPLVAIWAILGIISRQRALHGFTTIVVAGAICCSILLLVIIVSSTRKAEKLQTQ
jgi:hypothetical protein